MIAIYQEHCTYSLLRTYTFQLYRKQILQNAEQFTICFSFAHDKVVDDWCHEFKLCPCNTHWIVERSFIIILKSWMPVKICSQFHCENPEKLRQNTTEWKPPRLTFIEAVWAPRGNLIFVIFVSAHLVHK